MTLARGRGWAAEPPSPAHPARGPSAHVIDQQTGLFSEVFFVATLDLRLQAARRLWQPLGTIVIDLSVVRRAHPARSERTLGRQVAWSCRASDALARLDDGRYAVSLEHTPPARLAAVWERVRERLVDQVGPGAVAGASCYPITSLTALDLLHHAGEAAVAARLGGTGFALYDAGSLRDPQGGPSRGA